nr:hypothetical protein [Bacilli bacterium]
PGASVLINENVSVTSSGIVVYSKNTASDLKGAAGVVDYEKTNVDGVLVVNGTLNSTVLAGYVDTQSANGSITCSTRKETMYEVSSSATTTYMWVITGAVYYSCGETSLTGPVSTATGDKDAGDLPTGTTNSSSLGDRWDIVLSANLESVTFTSNNGTSSGANAPATYTLTASITPSSPTDFDTSYGYHWSSSDGTNGYFGNTSGTSTATGQTVTFKTTANSGSSDATVNVTVTVKNTAGTPFTKTITFTRTKAKSGGSCLLPTSLITMADGTQKQVKDIVAGELVRVFNHETGQIDVAPITFNDYESATLCNVIYLDFSNGKSIGVIDEHGFFDLDTMRYEYITEENYLSFVGHRFYCEDGSTATLVNASIKEEYTECYSPTSFYHLDYFVEGMLSMPGGITGLFNIFEYADNLQYDQEKMAQDIETYGLFTIDDLAPLGVTEIMFEAYAGQYLKVALGKGILTEEYLAYLIERYGGFTE